MHTIVLIGQLWTNFTKMLHIRHYSFNRRNYWLDGFFNTKQCLVMKIWLIFQNSSFSKVLSFQLMEHVLHVHVYSQSCVNHPKHFSNAFSAKYMS